MTHTVFIDLDSHVATASATGTAAPDVPLKHLTKQTLAFAFHSGGTVSAVTGWSTGRVVIKATPTSDVLLLDTTLAATGSTTSTRYSAEWAAVDCDSAALRTLIGASVEPLDVFAEIQWTADSGTHAVAFPIQIVPTFNLPEDDPPDPTEAASWTWLKARLAAGSNITFTDNDTTQVRTIAASGGGGGGGGSTDWGDIGGTLSDQTDLQTALNNKQPLASALTTLSSATAAGLALMDDADAAAQRTTLGLGNASTLNVGTSAGTVAAGDDARLSDARTPTAHAASHITGGSDAIQSATASQNGLATSAQITKLDGIEAGADVTDAGNVGSSIHGATAKTTPVDADTVPLIDSAASNVLKKLSWANIKATLKTYFDALYVTGPASATDNALVRFDGTTGKLVQNSGATLSDAGVITAPTLQSTPGNTSGAGAGGSGGIVDMRGGSGAEGSESGSTFAAGGNGGQVYTAGGSAFADDSLGYQFAGGSGGNINTSGGNASVDGAGAPGGAIYTALGGGSIDTLTGIIELGPQGARTTIQGNNSGDTSILLPPTEGTAGQFLSTDGAGNWDWSTPTGSGDVVGPASSVDADVALFDGTSGKLLEAVGFQTLIDTHFGSTQGAVIYRDSTSWTQLNPGTSGHVLTTGGAAANPSWAAPAGGGETTDNRLYTADDTWTNPSPSTAKRVFVRLVGGGGGGGSGRKGAAGTVRTGGGGAAAGAVVEFWTLTTELGSTESVVVGAGGTGGPAQTTNSTNGSNGAAGGTTTFAATNALGGDNGNGGATSSAAGGFAEPNSCVIGISSATSLGGATSQGAGSSGPAAGATTAFLPTGGGAGGGINTAGAASNGSAGGLMASVLTSLAGGIGGTSGGAGGNGNAGRGSGTGGGGGASSVSANAGAGGNGGGYGSGGGGGGAALDDTGNSGAGGNGAQGYALIVTYL